MNRWNDLVALAREIEAALASGVSIAPEKARRLAQMVLGAAEPSGETNGHEAAGRREPQPK